MKGFLHTRLELCCALWALHGSIAGKNVRPRHSKNNRHTIYSFMMFWLNYFCTFIHQLHQGMGFVRLLEAYCCEQRLQGLQQMQVPACMCVCVSSTLKVSKVGIPNIGQVWNARQEGSCFLLDATAGTSWCTGKIAGIHTGSAWVKDRRARGARGARGAPGMWICTLENFRKHGLCLHAFQWDLNMG